ncbi:hypothetical protein [Corynebacterium vitaeruminis]|uniref:hypothetical protein n=1 Tax=Corynebacterium vitaeruminis TaxID=38305 RepID=UPI0028A59F45|nr:hypothetical protein [Corynebacterium vitaeruminis]
MDLTAIASQLSDFKTVMGALADLTKLPQAISTFLFGFEGKEVTIPSFSSQLGDFKDTLSSK